MEKKNIALVAGGDSGEYVISMESAKMIKKNIDPSLYKVYTILIQKHTWVYIDEQGNKIPVDKNDFSITIEAKKVLFDCVFITIHGTPGEDGKLQGYFDLLDIPYTTAGLLASALTFNKHFCNMVVRQLGLPVARSLKLTRDSVLEEGTILKSVSLPVFVKPNKGGSSLGTTFVKTQHALLPSVKHAFEHDNEVLVEEYIQGVELTCGALMHEGKVKVLPVTEIISKTEARFFDFKAKYTKGASDEITPARISAELTRLVQDTTAFLYKELDMKGLTRFDYIYSQDSLFFLEVNVTPGMSETSIVPQQAEVEGISVMELFSMMIQEALIRRQ